MTRRYGKITAKVRNREKSRFDIYDPWYVTLHIRSNAFRRRRRIGTMGPFLTPEDAFKATREVINSCGVQGLQDLAVYYHDGCDTHLEAILYGAGD